MDWGGAVLFYVSQTISIISQGNPSCVYILLSSYGNFPFS